MNPPAPINVEKMFGTFVKSFDGTLVSEVVGNSPQFANADYLFRQQGVVAELKCMTKDVLADAAYQDEIGQAVERWIGTGKIPNFLGKARIQTAALPADCQREFFQILRKPVHGAIEKANRQIRETKANLNLPDAKGLLLLANDGCWSIETEAMLYLADISLGNRFTSINSVVYFTVNMPARMPGVDRDVLVWVPAARKDVRPVDKDFLGQLQKGWSAYHESLLGQHIPTIEIEEQQRIHELRFIRRARSLPRSDDASMPVQPVVRFEIGKFYTDSFGRSFRCLNLQGDLVTLMRFEIQHEGQVLDVTFSQNVKFAFHYMPLTDLAEIHRLEARYRRLK